MNLLTQSKNATILPVLIALTLGCFGLSPQARAVDPPPDGGYPNQNTAEGEDALFSLTTGADNTAMGFDALYSNVTGSDNDPASGNWRVTDRLNTARFAHTATLLQNGMVLVAGGIGQTDLPASTELYDPASRTWNATGSLNTARYSHTATLLQNGMVLVAGGETTNFLVLASAELGGRPR
jgi:Galactose oxidase, central domain